MSATDTYSNLVQQFYVAYFGRPADPAAVPSFAASLAAAKAPTTLADLTSAYYTSDTIRALIDNFGNSDESTALYGALTSDKAHATSFVTAIFNNLFNRAPVTAGLTFWVNAILSGSLSPGNAALTIAAAAAANSTAQGALDATTVANKTAIATLFTADLNTPAYVSAYAGASAAATARALLANVTSSTVPSAYAATVQTAANTIAHAVGSGLTNGVDTLTGPAFTAVLSAVGGATTLNAGDTLHGSAATNVLNITSDGSTLPTAITLDKIQTINIDGTGDQIAADVSGFSDVTALNITESATASGHASLITAGSATAVTIAGHVISGSSSGLTVNGGGAVTISAVGTTAAGAATVNSIAVNNAAGAVSVTEVVTAGVTNSVFNGVSVANAGADVTVAVALNSGAFDSTAGLITVNNAIGAVAITDAVNVTSLTAHTTQADTVSVQGGGASITVNETVTTVAATTGVSSVNEGAVVINGGVHTTSVTVNQAAPTAGAVAGVSHVTDATVQITDNAAVLHTSASNSITTATLSNYSAATFTGNALTNLTLGGGSGGAFTLVNNATGGFLANTTLNLALNALNGGLFDDSNNEITTLNVTTNGASTLTSLSDSGLTKLTVAGAGVLTLGSVPASLATLTVGGGAGFAGDISATGVTTFAPTGSGAITVTLNAATQTFTGGAGLDTVSIGANPVHAITGGAAAHNELVLVGAAATFNAVNVNTHATHFTTLGVSDSGADTNSYDMTSFAGYTGVDVVSGPSASDLFTHVAAGTTLGLSGSVSDVSYSLAAHAASETVAVSLGLTGGAAVNVGSLELTDISGGSATTVNLTTKGGNTSFIGTLNDTAVTALNISGTSGATIGALELGTPGLASPTGAASFALSNSASGVATITTLTDDILGTLTVSGSGASTIGLLEVDNAPTLALANNSGAALTIGTLATNGNSADVSSVGLATLNFSGGSVNIGTLSAPGNTAAHVTFSGGTATDSITSWAPGNSVTTLTITGNVALGAPATSATLLGTPVSLTATSGVTVAAGGDNARLNLALSGATVGAIDTITAGSGANNLADASSAGTVNISVGGGANHITLATNTSAGYSAHVTLGAHSAISADNITVGTVAAGAATPSVIITGAVSGDQLHFAGDTVASAVTLASGDLATAAGESSLALAVGFVDGLASTVAHSVTTFQWHSNTYVLESAGAGSGTLTAGDALVELAGLTSAAGIGTDVPPPTTPTVTAAITTYTGTAGADSFTAKYSNGDAGSTFVAADAIDGAGGSDTLVINPATANTASTLDDSNFGNGSIVNVENLVFGSTGSGAFSLVTGAHFAADFATVNLSATTTSGGLILNMAGYATAASVTTASTTGDQIISLDTTAATAAVEHISASSSSGNLSINVGTGATGGAYTVVANSSAGHTSVQAGGGTGNESYNITLGAHTGSAALFLSEIGSGAQATAGSYAANTVVTGIHSGDALHLALTGGTGAVLALGAEASVNAGVVAAYAGIGASELASFTFGGATYLVQSSAGTPSAADSSIIELVGVHGFSTVSGGIVTIAS